MGFGTRGAHVTVEHDSLGCGSMKVSRLIAATIVLLNMGYAHSEDNAVTEVAHAEYQCAKKWARQYAKATAKTDPSSDVATAALAACRNVRTEMAPGAAQRSGKTLYEVNQLLDLVEKEFQAQLIREVIETRAK